MIKLGKKILFTFFYFFYCTSELTLNFGHKILSLMKMPIITSCYVE